MKKKPPTILQRIAKADKTAVSECLDAHGNLIWALAKKNTDSNKDAETATQEIFLDIWKYADCFNASKHTETDFVILIARRRLLKWIANSAVDFSIKKYRSIKIT